VHQGKDVDTGGEVGSNTQEVAHAENNGDKDDMDKDIHGEVEEAEDSHVGVIPIHKGREVEQHCSDRKVHA
jgi:hypothetical protein